MPYIQGMWSTYGDTVWRQIFPGAQAVSHIVQNVGLQGPLPRIRGCRQWQCCMHDYVAKGYPCSCSSLLSDRGYRARGIAVFGPRHKSTHTQLYAAAVMWRDTDVKKSSRAPGRHRMTAQASVLLVHEPAAKVARPRHVSIKMLLSTVAFLLRDFKGIPSRL